MAVFNMLGKRILADSDVAQKRREVCDACPHRVVAICGKCGCPIVSKVNTRGASCPANRW